MTKIIFNADDFGISPGVNRAIQKAHQEGILNSASLMVNQQFAAEAIRMAHDMPHLFVGLHINLTNETPAADPTLIPHLVNQNGKFKNGFVNLFLLSLMHPRIVRREAEIEIRAQIEKYLKSGLTLDHLDSHRHVHLIPAIFKAVTTLRREYSVPRLRLMNENAWNTIRQNKSKRWLWDGGLIKYALLRALTFWNTREKGAYFYTILYTCKIAREQFQNVTIPKGYSDIEVMIHPGVPEVDAKHPEYVWDQNILSPWRTVELQTLLDKSVMNGIRFPNETE